MAYPCDLPANMGNNDIFRAIYAKLSDINPSTATIEQKLDVIQDQLTVVNNNIEANTKAIKDISINTDFQTEDLQNITNAIDRQTQAIKDASLNINVDVKVDTGKICDSIDKVNKSINTLDNNINSGFNRTIRTIKETRPRPKPVPHCQPQHQRPYHCMPMPEPNYDCHHHYLPNDNYFHNSQIQSNHNLTKQQKAYLEEVYRGEHKFDPNEYYLLPNYVPYVGLVNDVYNNMIYNL